MLNEYIMNSTAYQTYYAYASGDKEPKKARKFKKPASPKQKTILVSPKEPTKKPAKAKKDVSQTKKPTIKTKPTKKKASVKADRGKGLNVLSKVALSEVAQLKGLQNEARKNFTSLMQVAQGDSGEEEEDDDDDEDESKDKSDDDNGNDDDGDNNDNDDDSDHGRTKSDRDENPNLNQSNEEHEEEEEYVDERVHTPKNYELTDEEDNANNAKEENEEEKNDDEELYRDVNVNLRKEDVEMTDADQGGAVQHNVSQESGFVQVEEDAHVTLTAVHDTQKTEGPMQSSSVSSDFTDKLLNFENASPADNELAS
ncbi:hypothetical protein Tco_1057953 [Tanacetum coccineum]|uniref:Uncharacterized protein n=1 Tax=Tanacetum coccineum TaxID=301880 RepID=A0ABQ5H700_9ASTR